MLKLTQMKLRNLRSLFPNWNFFAQSGSQLEVHYRYIVSSETEWLRVNLVKPKLNFFNLFLNGEVNLWSLHKSLVEEIFFSKEVYNQNANLEILKELFSLKTENNLQILIQLKHEDELVEERFFQKNFEPKNA
jgi:hypothetical protein